MMWRNWCNDGGVLNVTYTLQLPEKVSYVCMYWILRVKYLRKCLIVITPVIVKVKANIL
jgi:hypothetical protein